MCGRSDVGVRVLYPMWFRPISLVAAIMLSVFNIDTARGQESEPRAVVAAFQDALLATMKDAQSLAHLIHDADDFGVADVA
jgi:hypothetical protein